MLLIMSLVGKKEKKHNFGKLRSVCKKLYRAIGIHSDLSKDFSPSKCSMQTFFMKPKIRFNMKF